MSLHFATREIGSLAKPSWRVKAFAGRPIEERDITEAKRWGARLALAGHEEFVQKLETGTAGLGEIDDWAVRYALALLERAGLDVVYDGEQRRTEMYDHVADFAGGFEPRGTVRSFDNKYYVKAAVVEAPSVPGPQDVDEYEFVRAHTDRLVKVPLTGAYTMVDWSYDEHYSGEGALGASAERRQDARRRFVSDVATSVISPTLSSGNPSECAPGHVTALLPPTSKVSTWRSTLALHAATIAGVEPSVPASPTPLAPSGLTGVGVTVACSSKNGKSIALGSA